MYGIGFYLKLLLLLLDFCDADWAGCHVTRQITTSCCIFLGFNCVSWSSKKQPNVAGSSDEAEYRALVVTPLNSHGLGIYYGTWKLLLCTHLDSFVILLVPFTL